MNDRELLALAAKAADIKIDKSAQNGAPDRSGFDMQGNAVLDWHNGKTWNPLTDDGDALRLAVKLQLDIRIYDDETVAETPWETGDQRAGGIDQLANTRRAIVLAAAQIGKMRKGQSS